jgi:hypothetical protein
VSLLDALIYGVRHVLDSVNNIAPLRSRLRFLGSVTVADNQLNDTIDVTIGGSVNAGPTIDNSGTGPINAAPSQSTGIDVTAIRFTGAAPELAGVVPGSGTGREVGVIAYGGPLIIRNDGGGASATNRILTGTGADVTLPLGSSGILVRDTITARWRLVSGGGGSTAELTRTITTSPIGSLDMTGYGHLDSHSSSVSVVIGAFIAPDGVTSKHFTIFNNNGDGAPLTLTHEDGAQTAADRIYIYSSTNLIINQGESYLVSYSQNKARWTVEQGTAIGSTDQIQTRSAGGGFAAEGSTLNSTGLNLDVPLGGKGGPLRLRRLIISSATDPYVLSSSEQECPIIDIRSAGGKTVELPTIDGAIFIIDTNVGGQDCRAGTNAQVTAGPGSLPANTISCPSNTTTTLVCDGPNGKYRRLAAKGILP